MRTAFPVGIIFLSCFSLLDRLVQAQLRDHIRKELLAEDAEVQRANLDADGRMARSLAALAEVAGIPRAHGDKSNGEQLKRLGDSLDEDVLALYGPDRQPIVTLRREGKVFQQVSGTVALADGRKLTGLDGQYYFFSTYPLLRDGKAAGWIAAGRRWLREMPIGSESYLIVKQGKVLESAGIRAQSGIAAGDTLPACAGEGTSCEIGINNTTYVLLRSAASGKGEELAIHILRSSELIASSLLSTSRLIILAGALLSILGALGLALLTGRAISRPLKDITESCLQAQDAGNLSEIQLPSSRIEEVNALGQTLQSAVRSIGAGQTQLTQAYFQFMGAIVALLDARDTYTAGHSHRVSAYSEALARDFGLPQRQIDDIRVGALLHDIGKIGVPDEVLRKHERLTKEEFDLMKQHPTIGRKVLEQVVQFDKYLDAVELHHENLDGTGYPRGLRGEQIPISARIVKVADVYDALSTDRPYRKKMTQEEVHGILRDGAGKHFDRLLVEIFLARSIPSFEQHAGLSRLHQAVGDSSLPSKTKKAVGA